ncbi:MAG: hypothetical protein H6Q00_1134 [Holophagaceae bacterium]|nr:hypothetical protein [Holophagaceae bacterium]
MANHRIGSSWRSGYSFPLVATCLLGALVAGGLLSVFGSQQELHQTGLSLASRMLNQFTTVVVTSIALIIPLSANLYSPRLVKLYVAHPLIVVCLSVLVFTHLLLLGSGVVPPGTSYHRLFLNLVSVALLVVLAGMLPFLFGISQFLRPSFFMPMLTRKAIRSLALLGRGQKTEQNSRDLFEITDVVANIALTGMARGDRQLVLIAIQSLHAILTELVGCGGIEPSRWRALRPHFVPGLAREGQAFLVKERLWPEAYLLAQLLKVMEVANKRQHELMAELAGQLVESAELASVLCRDRVVELHIMAFNSLLRESIEERDLRRFQNLSYHYRLLIEAFLDQPRHMYQAAEHLISYGHLADEVGMSFGLKTVVFDMGELVLSIALRQEERAVELVQLWAGPLWQEAILSEGGMKMAGWRTLVKVYWEAKARGLGALAETLYWRYLSDEIVHREHVELILDEDRELHIEFNDRLLRFAHLSPEASAMALAFTEE